MLKIFNLEAVKPKIFNLNLNQKQLKTLVNVVHYSLNFFQKRSLPDIYRDISIEWSQYRESAVNFKAEDSIKNRGLVRIYRIPPYFKLELNNQYYRKFGLKEIDKGYLIDLTSYNTIDDYTIDQLSSRKRKQMRSAINRLESCLDISYKFYFGNIAPETYNKLMDRAKVFASERFNQVNKRHHHLGIWKNLKQRFYDLILEKKASIFVIYDGENPIDICLNYHLKGVTCNIFTSFDINYSKFGLGSIDLYKQLEWNINNNYSIFDMCMGESNYKKTWSNTPYELKHHVIIKKGSWLSHLIAIPLLVYLKLRFKLYRYSYENPNNWILKRLGLSSSDLDKTTKSIETDKAPFELMEHEVFKIKLDRTQELDMTSDENLFLKKSYLDYLHRQKVHKNGTKAYQSLDNKDTYYIKSANNILEINVKR
ncbi:GNAT family N-acetyltransferase [Seonamhaeicola sp.]|uniref:GNAT family N-acetyltransferase n=1 Tax=Seonamhaeicola sp. TaxID=1912245 RepID=UPI00260C34DA|nr:GNAT family N-acetyltransferase [Seonamhaeicola sp.]